MHPTNVNARPLYVRACVCVCVYNSAAKFQPARCGVTPPLTPSPSTLILPPPLPPPPLPRWPDLNYAYVTVLNSVPGRSGHFGSLRTRAALNSPGGRRRGGRETSPDVAVFDRRPIRLLDPPSIVTCFFDDDREWWSE